MATSFVEKLRMNNIYSPSIGDSSGGYDGSDEISPEYITSILNTITPFQQEREDRERRFQKEMFQMQQKGQLDNIARQMRTKAEPTNQPMNVVFQPSMTDYQRGTLDLRRQEIGQRGQLGQQKYNLSERDINIKERRAELAEKIADGKATDEEKQEYELAKIEARGDVGSRQITERGDIGSRQIGERGEIQKDIQETRGKQGLMNIAARARGQQELQAGKPVKEELPTQTRVRESNAARQLINTRPDLAKFVKTNPDGSFTISPPSAGGFFSAAGPTKQQLDEINSIIYGTTKEVKPTTKKEEPKKPVQSKYKVTVE